MLGKVSLKASTRICKVNAYQIKEINQCDLQNKIIVQICNVCNDNKEKKEDSKEITFLTRLSLNVFCLGNDNR